MKTTTMARADDIIPGEWWPNLESAIVEKDIPSFPTKSAAQAAAKAFGWEQYRVVRVIRRFEKIWIVATVDFQPSYEAGILFKTLRVSLLKWEKRPDGITHCPVVIFRKPEEKR